MNYITTCLIATMYIFFSTASDAQKRQSDFMDIMDTMTTTKDSTILEVPTSVDVEVWRGEASDIDPNISLPAIIKLWIIGAQSDYLKLEWWEKRNNAKYGRMLIVSFYECAILEPITAKPDFKMFSMRFSNAEKKERIDEIEYVIANRPAIAKLLASVIRNTDAKLRSPDVNNMLKRYERTASQPSP